MAIHEKTLKHAKVLALTAEHRNGSSQADVELVSRAILKRKVVIAHDTGGISTSLAPEGIGQFSQTNFFQDRGE